MNGDEIKDKVKLYIEEADDSLVKLIFFILAEER